jgi:hypothetical protein
MTPISRRPLLHSLLPAATVAVLALAGCASENQKASSAPERQATDQPTAGAPSGSDGGTAFEPATPTGADVARPLDLVGPTQLLVVHARVDLQVDDVGATVGAVVDVARRHSGLVYDSQIDLGNSRDARGELVLRIPPAEVDGAIADLARLGTVVSRSQSTDDVTDQVIDVEARILTARASVASVRALMERTTDLNQLVFLENELTTRETVLEQLLAHQRNLTADVALATLTVGLSTAPAPPPVVATGDTDRSSSLGAAFETGWQGFLTVVVGIAIAFAYAAPFLAVALLVGAFALLIRRLRPPRSRAAVPPPLPAPVGDPHTSEPDSAAMASSH